MKLNAHLVYIAPVILVLMVCLIYWQGMHGPWVFDDYANIRGNIKIRSLSQNVESGYSFSDAAFSAGSGIFRRPIPLLSFGINHYYSGLNSFPYKLTNLIIHLLNGLGVFFLTTLLFRRWQDINSNNYKNKNEIYWFSFIVSAIWLLHPLNVTSVLYIVQRMNSLSTLFLLSGLIGYCFGRTKSIAGTGNGSLIAFSSLIVGGLLAVLSKENGVLILPFAFLIEIIFFKFQCNLQESKKFKYFFAFFILTPLIMALILVILFPNETLALKGYALRNFTLTERLLTESRVVLYYLKQIILPNFRDMGLFLDDFAISRSLLNPISTLPSIFGVFFLLLVCIVSYKKYPLFTFGIGWFLIGHSLESTFIPLELIHEHRNYLPQYGVIVLVLYVLSPILFHPGSYNRTRTTIVVLIAVLLSYGTYARAYHWKDKWTLLHMEVQNHPNSARSVIGVGTMLNNAGMYKEARPYFLKAIALRPDNLNMLIRTIHHIYTADNSVPDLYLRLLKNKILELPHRDITVLLFEDLILITRKNRETHSVMLKLLKLMLTSKNKYIEPDWEAYAQHVLGKEYEYRKNYKQAILHYKKALGFDPQAGYYALRLAEQYLAQKKPKQAINYLDLITTSNLDLEKYDLQVILKLRSRAEEFLKKSEKN